MITTNFRNHTNSELMTFIANCAPRNHFAEAEACTRILERRYVPVHELDDQWEKGFDVGYYEGIRDTREEVISYLCSYMQEKMAGYIDEKYMRQILGRMANQFPEMKPLRRK